MHANLVGSPGLNRDFEQRKLRAPVSHPLEYFPMRDGGATILSCLTACCHPSAPHAIAGDGCAYRAMIGFHPSVNEGQIGLLDLPLRKLAGESAVGCVSLGDDDESAGPFIEPVDDSRTQRPTDLGDR